MAFANDDLIYLAHLNRMAPTDQESVDGPNTVMRGGLFCSL
jgi:hypothetical protein